MSEKVGRLGRGLQRVNLLSYGRENLRESNVLPMTKRSKRFESVFNAKSKRFECLSSFLKYLFGQKLARFCCFSPQFFTLYIIPFSKQNQTKTEPEV